MIKLADIETTWTPSFVIVDPATPKGLKWLRAKCGKGDGPRSRQYVEHRYIADIVIGAREDGLTVETTN